MFGGYFSPLNLVNFTGRFKCGLYHLDLEIVLLI